MGGIAHTLHLKGDNTISKSGSSGWINAIYADVNSMLTITVDTDATLTATGSGGSLGNFGISAQGGLKVKGGTITATGKPAAGGKAEQCYGIYVGTSELAVSKYKSCTIEDGVVNAVAEGTLDNTNDNAISAGFSCYGMLYVKGGELNASNDCTLTGGDNRIYGIFNKKGIEVSGGTLTAAAANGTGILLEQYQVSSVNQPTRLTLKETGQFTASGGLRAVTSTYIGASQPDATPIIFEDGYMGANVIYTNEVYDYRTPLSNYIYSDEDTYLSTGYGTLYLVKDGSEGTGLYLDTAGNIPFEGTGWSFTPNTDDPESMLGRLTLTDFHYTATREEALYASNAFELELKGDNSLTNGSDMGDSAIACEGILTMVGDGTLAVTAKAENSIGIIATKIRVIGPTVTAEGTEQAMIFEPELTSSSLGLPFGYISEGAWNSTMIEIVPTYPVAVDGTYINADNMDDVLGDGTMSYTPATAATPQKLTLDDCSCESILAYGDLDIVLKNGTENEVTNDSYTYAVRATAPETDDGITFGTGDGDINISGSGSLSATGPTASRNSNNYGIDCEELTIDGVTVEATGGYVACTETSNYSAAIHAESITIINNAMVTATGGYASSDKGTTASSYGVYGDCTVNNSTRIAKSDIGPSVNEAIHGTLSLIKSAVKTASILLADGSLPTAYIAADHSDYKYLKVVPTNTVTFDENGHGTAPDTQTVFLDEKAVCPIAPAADGYVFSGWYTEAACENEYDFDTEVTENLTLYAFWRTTLTGAELSTDIPVVGVEITAEPLPDGATADWQWYTNSTESTEDGIAISGATGANYIPVEADLDHYLYAVGQGTGDFIGEVRIVTAGSVIPFAPVTNLTMKNSASVRVNTNLTLSGKVTPANATNQTILWSVEDAGSTGATITNGVFHATNNGTVIIMATVVNGASATTDYTKTFNINVIAAPSEYVVNNPTVQVQDAQTEQLANQISEIITRLMLGEAEEEDGEDSDEENVISLTPDVTIIVQDGKAELKMTLSDSLQELLEETGKIIEEYNKKAVIEGKPTTQIPIELNLPTESIMEQLAIEDITQLLLDIQVPQTIKENDEFYLTGIHVAPEVFKEASEQEISLSFAIRFDENGKPYVWSFDKTILEEYEKNETPMNLMLTDKTLSEEEQKQFGNSGSKLNFQHQGAFPSIVELSIPTGKQPGSILYLYYHNTVTGLLEQVPNNQYTVDENSNVILRLVHSSEYILSDKELTQGVTGLLEQIQVISEAIIYCGESVESDLLVNAKKEKIGQLYLLPMTLILTNKFTADIDRAFAQVQLTFSSEHSDIADVDQNGSITAKANGSTVITVTAKLADGSSKQYQTMLTVKEADLRITKPNEPPTTGETDTDKEEKLPSEDPSEAPSEAPSEDTALTKETIYIVVKGDTLWKISQKFKVTTQDIIKANSIKNANFINVGQKLVIPAK